MYPLNKIGPYAALPGKTIKDVSHENAKYGGFQLFFTDGSDILFDFPDRGSGPTLTAYPGESFNFLANVKEHATLSAGASVDHGVEVGTTQEHVNRAADRGCVSRLVGCSSFSLNGFVPTGHPPMYSPDQAEAMALLVHPELVTK
jgi:hypothetical protein